VTPEIQKTLDYLTSLSGVTISSTPGTSRNCQIVSD